MADVDSSATQSLEGLRYIRLHYAGRNGQRRLRRITILLLISILALSTYLVVGPTNVTQGLLSFTEIARARPIAFSAALFIVWTALFITAVPLGSVTVMMAGFIFGPLAGFLQAASQLTSSVLLYGLLPEPHNEIVTKSRAIKLVQNHPIFVVIAIRLVPILPSALSVIACREFCISLRHMVIGTLCVGWVRPVSLAWIGSRLPDIQALLQQVP